LKRFPIDSVGATFLTDILILNFHRAIKNQDEKKGWKEEGYKSPPFGVE